MNAGGVPGESKELSITGRNYVKPMNGQGGFANERLMCPLFLTCHGKQAKQCVPRFAINGLVRAALGSRMPEFIQATQKQNC